MHVLYSFKAVCRDALKYKLSWRDTEQMDDLRTDSFSYLQSSFSLKKRGQL